MTQVQIQNAYRLAVEACLVTFCKRTRQEASQLVGAWWENPIQQSDLRSGAYLHTEAFNIALDLAGIRQLNVTLVDRERYQRILRDSSRAALKSSAGKPVRRAAVAKQMAG